MSERQAKAHLVCVSRMVEGTTPAIAEKVLAELEAAVREEALNQAFYAANSDAGCELPDHCTDFERGRIAAAEDVRALGKEATRGD